MTSFYHTANEAKEFYLPKLEYSYDSLEPYIDAETMKLHHSLHHQAYINKLNGAVQSHPELATMAVEEILQNFERVPEGIKKIVKNHGGGHANHCFFWEVLAPKGGEPSKELGAQLDKYFGNIDGFKDQLAKAALATFGSGWAWLSLNAQKELVVESTPNQDSPLLHKNVPLFGIDVWEHAYYLRYQNRRAEYVQNIFKVINWQNVNERYQAAISK